MAEEVRIEEVISRKYPLKWKGGSRRYMIPADDEPSSLVVDTVMQLFNWNAHGIHGNVITWLREVEGLSDSEIDHIRKVPVSSTEPEQKSGVTIEQALSYHRALLSFSGGHPAMAELLRRGVSDDSINRFKLGYASDFGGCITIPYFMHGELIGIKARVLGSSDEFRKYMAFRGSKFPAFNYNEETIVIVEGEFKAIALYQAGISAMGIAASGFTKSFLRLLVQPRYIYVRDNDAAGLSSALHAQILLGERLSVCSTPSEKAVDDYLLTGETRWLNFLTNLEQSLKSSRKQNSKDSSMRG